VAELVDEALGARAGLAAAVVLDAWLVDDARAGVVA
jgi:hypothetical protein